MSLSQVKLLTPPVTAEVSLIADIVETKDIPGTPAIDTIVTTPKAENEVSAEYEGAGKIFIKAALWDLGIFSEENIKEADWLYYLTYSKGIKVVLENGKDFFIELILPIERCIREAADGLINNVKPLIVHKVSDEDLFKTCMEAQAGPKINNISIVGQNDHIILDFNNIVEFKRSFMFNNRLFVENYERNMTERSKLIFFSQNFNNINFINNTMNLRGFDSTNKDENIVTLLVDNTYNDKPALQEAVEKLNGMFLRDEQNRALKLKIQENV